MPSLESIIQVQNMITVYTATVTRDLTWVAGAWAEKVMVYFLPVTTQSCIRFHCTMYNVRCQAVGSCVGSQITYNVHVHVHLCTCTCIACPANGEAASQLALSKIVL